MKIGVITVCYNQVDTIQKLAKSVFISEESCYLYLFSTSRSSIPVCDNIAMHNESVVYFPYGKNVGVSRCWNEGLMEAYDDGMDAAIIINDDCWFSPGDIKKLGLAAKAHKNDQIYAITCAGFHYYYARYEPSLGFSCVVITPRGLEAIGCFDQNIFPAYLEDCDYAYRASLLGLQEANEPDTCVHHIGSATIFSNPALQVQNHRTHTLNFEYYRRKWGGINGEERFTTPFNDKRFTPKIAPENRDAPYPGYNRTDHDVVRL